MNREIHLISKKIVNYNLINYSRRNIVEKLLKKNNWKKIESYKKHLDNLQEKKLNNLSKKYKKEIEYIKKLILFSYKLKDFVDFYIKKKNRNHKLIIVRDNNAKKDICNIKIPKKNNKIFATVFVYDNLITLFKKIKKLNLKTNINIFKKYNQEILKLILNLNNCYKGYFKILKESRLLTRKYLDNDLKKYKNIFYASNFFVGKVNNYIIKNNSNKIYNQNYIYNLNLNYWKMVGCYKYNCFEDYLLFLNDRWFK